MKNKTPNHIASFNCHDCRRRLGLGPARVIPAVVTVSIPPDELKCLRDELKALQILQQDESPESLVAAGRQCGGLIAGSAPTLAEAMGWFFRQQNSPDAAFITGLPQWNGEEDGVGLGTLLSLGMAFLAGEPFQYSTQNGGRLVGILSPKPDFDGVPNTGESREDFAGHTDDAVLVPDWSTDLIQLLGLVNESRAETRFVPLTQILSRLSPDSRVILAEPRYVFRAPHSFKLAAPYFSPPRSILFTGEDRRDMIRLPTFSCSPADGEDTEAKTAMAEICSLAEDPMLNQRFVVGPGTALIFNNNRGLHSRKAFVGQRKLLRTYIRQSLDLLREKSGVKGPIFDPAVLLGQSGNASKD